MPFALSTVGVLLIVTGFQDTYKQFGKLLAGDFTGSNNFLYWFGAIFIVGSIGYIKPLEKFSRVFLSLIVVAIILSQSKNSGGIYAKIKSALSSESSTQDTTIGTPVQASASGSNTGNGSSSGLSNIAQDASIASTVASFF